MTANIKWYRPAPGAKFLGIPTIFGAANWIQGQAWNGPGEVCLAPRTWEDGSLPIVPAGQGSPCGSPSLFLNGWPGPVPAALPRLVSGPAFCCNVFMAQEGQPGWGLQPSVCQAQYRQSCTNAYPVSFGAETCFYVPFNPAPTAGPPLSWVTVPATGDTFTIEFPDLASVPADLDLVWFSLGPCASPGVPAVVTVPAPNVLQIQGAGGVAANLFAMANIVGGPAIFKTVFRDGPW